MTLFLMAPNFSGNVTSVQQSNSSELLLSHVTGLVQSVPERAPSNNPVRRGTNASTYKRSRSTEQTTAGGVCSRRERSGSANRGVKAQPGLERRRVGYLYGGVRNKAIVGDLPRNGLITQQRVGILEYGGAFGTMGRLDDALDVLQRAVSLNGEVEESRVLANDD